MTPNKNEGLIARLWSLSRKLITGSERQTVEEAARAIQDLEEEAGRLRAYLTALWSSVYEDTQRSPQALISLGTIQAADDARNALAFTADG